MTDKEKMLAGLPYRAFGKELFEERQHAKQLVFEFNRLEPNKLKERNQILRKLLGKTQKTFFIEPPFRCDYGYNIEIGHRFYSNYGLIILDCAKVTIGDDVLIGPNVGIYTAGHPIDAKQRAEGWELAKPITIGNRVWIGGGSILNPGVRIGDNSIIGSGSVVTKDIPPSVIAVGNPCRVLREVTEADRLNLL